MAKAIDAAAQVQYARESLERGESPYDAIRILRRVLHDPRALSHAVACEALDWLVQAHFLVDELDEARRAARHLISRATRVGDAHRVADAEVLLGKVELHADRLDIGHELFRRAERTFRRLGDRHGEARVLHRMGELHIRLSQPKRAASFCRRAAALFSEERDPYGRATCLLTLTEALNLTGKYDESLATLREARSIFRRSREVRGLVNCKLKQAEILLLRGHARRAIAVAASARAGFRQLGDRRSESDTLNLAGRARHVLGEIELALSTHREARECARSIGYRDGEASALVDMASALLHSGRVEAALASLKRAEDIFREVDNILGEAHAIHGAGVIWYQLGRYGDAQEAFTRASDLYRSASDDLGRANCDVCLGRLLVVDGEERQAAATFRTALRAYRAQGDWVGEADALSQIAGTYERRGRIRDALRFVTEAATVAKGRDALARATAFAIRGRLHFETGAAADGLRDYARARRVYVKEGAHINIARLETDLARRLEALGMTRQARAAVGRAFRALEDVRRKNPLPDVHADVVEQFDDALRIALRIAWQRRRLREFVAEMESRRAWTLGRPPGPRTAKRRDRTQTAAGDVDGAHWIGAAQRLTEDGSVVVAWYPPTADGTLPCLVAHGDSVSLLEVTATVDAILPLLNAIHDRAARRETRGWDPTLVALGDALLRAPVRVVRVLRRGATRLAAACLGHVLERADDRALRIVPHGLLHLVPWAALATHASGRVRYLAEDRPVLLMPTLPTGSAPTAPPRRPRSALLLATESSTLPHTRDEVDALRSLLEGAGVRVTAVGGERAGSPDALLELAARHDLFHIASHAEFDATNPFQSQVDLGVADCASDDDLALRLDRVLRAVLAPTTVFLSACSTALADWNRVFDPIALTTAFVSRGASHAVGTLWQVDDRSTAAIVGEIYRRVLLADQPWPRAVRDAQVAMLRGEVGVVNEAVPLQPTGTRGLLGAPALASQNFRAPYHWAAFQVVGA